MSHSTQMPRNDQRPWRRRMAWTLVASLANPASVIPLSLYSSVASARDTDIYLSTTYAGSTAEPAILLILDTSDSMNVTEGWREYPGAYDSHVEYLWNDIGVISNTEVAAANANQITTAAAPILTKYGSWSGATLAERQALWNAAKAYANATEPGDPGARNTYRNYNDANWIYWLPAGTAESDTRLWSNAFNRWAGGVKQSGFPANVRGGIDYGSTDDSRSFNKCNDSLDKLLPSTVFAPTTYPRNTGKYLNQEWQRWEPYLDLTNGRVTNNDTTYPTTLGATQVPASGTLAIQAGSVVGSIGSAIQARSEFLGTAGGVAPYPVRDSYPRFSSTLATIFGNNVINIGDQGQPIRTQAAGSRAGWTDLKADMGGFNFQAYVNGLNSTQLVNVLALYGVGATTTTAKHKAWKGNRDSTGIPFGQITGTPAYYDHPGSLLRLPAGVATTTTLCTRTCTLDADPGVAGNQGVFSAHDSGSPPKDGDDVTKYYVKSGASCVSTGTSGSDCSTLPAACAAPSVNNSYKTINNTGCTWSGRSSIVVEGVGTYYYGGTCSGSCRGQGFLLGSSDCPSGATSPNYCDETLPDLTIGGTVYPNAGLGAGNGTGTGCTNKADTSTTCPTREGFAGCRYLATTTPCVNTSVTTTSAVGNNDYTVYPLAAKTDKLEHDCKADNSAANGFLTTATNRTFGTAWNATSSASGTTAAYTPTDPAATYPAADMYSVNYLNWKFGPKGPNGAPIGRKTRLQIAKDALTDLVAVTDGVRFGLMVYNKMPNDLTTRLTQGSQGGNVAYAVRRMGVNIADSDYVNRATLATAINGVVATGTTPLTEVMYEAYRYFRGETPVYGTDATPAVGGGDVSGGRDTTAVGADGKYVSPMMSNPNSSAPAACQKNYVVLVSDGGPENDNQADTAVNTLTQGPPFLAATISTQQATPTLQFEDAAGVPYGPTDIVFSSNYVWLDELTYFMANGDMSPGGASSSDTLTGMQSVNTYTIGFAGGNSPVLVSAAQRGKGINYLAEDSAALSAALSAAIVAIREWNPTMAAPVVPLSAANRGSNADDVYLAFFGPSLQQAWEGTVKKYKLSTASAVCGQDLAGVDIPLCLKDSLGTRIEEYTLDTASGEVIAKIRDTAVSFWSDPAAPDGGKPNQGGTGYVLKNTPLLTPATRTLYTHLSSSTQSDLTNAVNAMSEANNNISKTLLGDAAMSDAARAALVNYARGGDPASAACSDNDVNTACANWRSWPPGDILHSNPVTLIYDSDADGVSTTDDPVVYLFYLSNDGLLHAVDTATGQEKWAFMPEENLAKLAAMKTNAVGEHLIAGDGSPRLYVVDVDRNGKITSGDKAYLLFSMRRGGRAVYALDVSERDAPRFMWKVDNNTLGFSELGETWSNPAITRMRTSADPVAVFAAGYDPVANDQLTVTINRLATTATVNTPIDHGYVTNEQVTVSGAFQSEYNGTQTITVTGARSFTYTVAGSPLTPATGNIRVESTRAATMGRGVFFVNARTGALIKSFTPAASGGDNTQVPGMDFSIPSDAVPINTDLDTAGYADRLYLGDLGGNVWRFDIDDPSPAAWKALKFADLTNGATPRRRLMFPPAVVKQLFLDQRFDAVYVGTGDRENPLRTDNLDYLFMIKDFEIGLSSSQTSPVAFSIGTGTTQFYDLTSNLIQFGTAAEQTSAKAALKGTAGWVLRLERGALAGEKVVNAPTVVFNILSFGTYSPLVTASACVPPGRGANYLINALDGSLIIDTNHDGTITTTDSRVTEEFRGYPSEMVVISGRPCDPATDPSCTPPPGTPPSTGTGCGTPIRGLTTADGITKSTLLGWACAAQRAYWFQEPE